MKLKLVNGPTHYDTHEFAPLLRELVPWLTEVWGS